jgi:hypothetical protein
MIDAADALTKPRCLPVAPVVPNRYNIEDRCLQMMLYSQVLYYAGGLVNEINENKRG